MYQIVTNVLLPIPSGIAFDKECDPQVKYSACVVVEATYFLHNSNIILPYYFLLILTESLVS